MIKVKVTKNIIRKGNVAFGLNIKQIVIVLIGVIIGILMLVTLKDKISVDALMCMIFATMAVVIFSGIIQINGISLISFLLKSVNDKRPFNREGVFNSNHSEFIELNQEITEKK